MAAPGLILSLVGKIGDAVFHTKQDRDKLKKALAQAETDGNVELKKIGGEIETTLVKARVVAVAAEAKSDSWLAANWRPVVILLLGSAHRSPLEGLDAGVAPAGGGDRATGLRQGPVCGYRHPQLA